MASYDKLLNTVLLHKHNAKDITDLSTTLDSRYVLKAGDTMAGTLNTQSLIPTSNNSYNLGSTGNYFSTLYAVRAYFNSAAYLDGATSGQITVDGTLYIDATSATGLRMISNGNNGVTLDGSSLSPSKNNWNIKQGSDGTFLFDQGGGMSGRFKLGGTSAGTYFDWTPDFSNSYFKVADNKVVTTFTNTLDDGTGGLVAARVTDSALTAGSIVFAGIAGLLSQNNAKFFWDNTNNRLGIGTASPLALLHLNQAAAITGTGTITTVARVVTGSGTLFLTELSLYDTITATNGAGNSESRIITGITNDTTAQIDSNFTSDIVSGATFTIQKVAFRAGAANAVVPNVVITALGNSAWTGISPTSGEGFRVQRSPTDTANNGLSAITSATMALNPSPTATSAANFYGGFFVNQTVGNQNITGRLAGAAYDCRSNATSATISTLDGQFVFLRNNSTGTITTMNGQEIQMVNNVAGTVGTMNMANAAITSSSTGTIGAANGYNLSVNNTGTMSNVSLYLAGLTQNSSGNTLASYQGLSTKVTNTAGTITTLRNIYIQSLANSGTVTNAYGIFIDSQTAGTNTNNPFGVFVNGVSDWNYFAGGITIGTQSQTAGRGLTINPTARTSGTPSILALTAPADTGLTIAEFNDVSWNLSASRAFTTGGGTITNQRAVYIQAPTYTAATNAVTLTNAATLYIDRAPQQGTNVTITTAAALWINAGNIFMNANNIATDTTTGMKIGTATSQKLSLWNATPIVQPTTAVAVATFVANTSGIANDTATWDGYTIGQVVKALRNIGLLA